MERPIKPICAGRDVSAAHTHTHTVEREDARAARQIDAGRGFCSPAYSGGRMLMLMMMGRAQHPPARIVCACVCVCSSSRQSTIGENRLVCAKQTVGWVSEPDVMFVHTHTHTHGRRVSFLFCFVLG